MIVQSIIGWLRKGLKQIIPKALLSWRRKHLLAKAVWRYTHYDADRFIRQSGIASNDVATLWAKLTRLQHVLEKALSLPQPRAGFGDWALQELLEVLPAYVGRVGHDRTATGAILALRGYLTFHEERQVIPPYHQEIIGLLNSFQLPAGCAGDSPKPTLFLNRDDLMKKARFPFADFALCRHSVRQFGAEAVTDDQILHAVGIAQKSPSVCNRQGARVHIYSDEAIKRAILEIQSGSRGFGHLASHVIIITFDMRCLLDPGERHQAWIDGGLFAMSFLYAVHSLGLGACPLHWCVSPADDLALRTVAEIPESEEMIMLIAVGSLPPTFRVAASARKELHEVARLHGVHGKFRD